MAIVNVAGLGKYYGAQDIFRDVDASIEAGDRIGLVSDENTVVRTGPRVIEGFEFIAKLVHPDLIK